MRESYVPTYIFFLTKYAVPGFQNMVKQNTNNPVRRTTWTREFSDEKRQPRNNIYSKTDSSLGGVGVVLAI